MQPSVCAVIIFFISFPFLLCWENTIHNKNPIKKPSLSRHLPRFNLLKQPQISFLSAIHQVLMSHLLAYWSSCHHMEILWLLDKVHNTDVAYIYMFTVKLHPYTYCVGRTIKGVIGTFIYLFMILVVVIIVTVVTYISKIYVSPSPSPCFSLSVSCLLYSRLLKLYHYRAFICSQQLSLH